MAGTDVNRESHIHESDTHVYFDSVGICQSTHVKCRISCGGNYNILEHLIIVNDNKVILPRSSLARFLSHEAAMMIRSMVSP